MKTFLLSINLIEEHFVSSVLSITYVYLGNETRIKTCLAYQWRLQHTIVIGEEESVWLFGPAEYALRRKKKVKHGNRGRPTDGCRCESCRNKRIKTLQRNGGKHLVFSEKKKTEGTGVIQVDKQGKTI